MKKNKFAIHWQILLALILAVIFGILFPNTYKVTDESFKLIESQKIQHQIPDNIIFNLENNIGAKPVPEEAFINNIVYNTEFDENHESLKFILEETKYNPPLKYVGWMGILFLRALKMIIIPLILISVIAGIANIGSAENLGRLGLKTFIYYISTGLLAIFSGLFFVNIIKPGVGIDKSYGNYIDVPEKETISISDTVYNIIPENIFKSVLENQMLSIIFFSILFGFFITKVKPGARIMLTDLFNSGLEVIMKITMFIIIFTPFGVFGIVAQIVADQSGLLIKYFEVLGMYGLTVITGLVFHSIVILPILLKVFGNVNPYAHFKAVRSALLTAFSTSSSNATLSLTMETVEYNSGVSNKISGFTLPLGANLNMDGTALYEAVAALFIAQAYGYDLGVVEQSIIVITALLASIGGAGRPLAGMFMMSIVLSAVDLPLAGIALIIPIDRILDMARTSVNVWSDSCCAVIIAKTEGEQLKV
jgi:proton glutamate symport protein